MGDKKIKENKLKKIIISEEAKFWKFISSRKFLELNRINLDEKLLYNYYRNKGYYKVSVESSSAKVMDESNFELIFNIKAGNKYYFGNIDLIKPEEYAQESKKKIMDVQNSLEGKIHPLDKIKQKLNKIDEMALTKEWETIKAKYQEEIMDNKINQ
jgi:Outer membrane protein/protective antigen OMA87